MYIMAPKPSIVVGVLALVILAILGYIFLFRSHSKDNVGIAPIFGPIELPKAPYWDAERQSIYFVDVYQSAVHRYEPKTRIHKWTLVGNEPIAFVIPIQNTSNKFVISYGPNLAVLTWDGNSSVSTNSIIGPIDGNATVYRANEGKVSPSGSLFVGTHSPFINQTLEVEKNKAALYAIYENTRKSKKLLDNVTIANGMGWSKNGKRFYFIDSPAHTVESFSYDIKTDNLGDRKTVCNFKVLGVPGVPDGMAIDTDDKLWVTSFGGHQILRIDPDSGLILRKINLDALQITSAVFAGPSMHDFYITSGFYKSQSDPSFAYKHSGYIFEALNFEFSGYPGVPFNMTELIFEKSEEMYP